MVHGAVHLPLLCDRLDTKTSVNTELRSELSALVRRTTAHRERQRQGGELSEDEGRVVERIVKDANSRIRRRTRVVVFCEARIMPRSEMCRVTGRR